MNSKEKIVNILMNTLNYCYCDNCKYSDDNIYGDQFCESCHRKYQNWALAEHTAKDLASVIENQYKKIIEYLIEWLEDEHIGLSNVVKEALEEKFDFSLEN